MINVLAWLTGSRVGQYMAGAVLIAAIVLIAIWRIFSAGKNAAKIEAIQESVNAFAKRVTTDNDLERMSAAERRQRLQQHWTVAE